MDKAIDISTQALADPPAELADLAPQLAAIAQPADAADAAAAPSQPEPTRSHAEGDNAAIGHGLDAKLQVVDENQRFTTSLDKHMQGWGLAHAGFKYDVVAVFGSQSTGKSTLLNKLFGTRFDVMSESERRQTTKGIWMSKAADLDVLVMDVEGTDGRERGEDQDFERKSALFSMAVAEVLIVNIWEHQVGLYQGANMGLLKTVFEVNLGLFLAAKQNGKDHTAAAAAANALTSPPRPAHLSSSSQDKTLLLFVIRDHIGATPLANLRATLSADLNRLWDGLSKPAGLETSTIETFFDLDFVALPHKLLQPEQFDQSVFELRKRFVKPAAAAEEDEANGYVFKSKYHKRIPADGISTYMHTIWDAVVSNKDLDLPTQQELLAQFRCGEIATQAFELFSARTDAFPAAPGAGKIDRALGDLMRAAVAAALALYDADASRYHSAVYGRQRAELVGKVHAALHPLVVSHLKNLHKLVLRQFRLEIELALKSEGYDFARVVREAKRTAEQTFKEEADKVVLDQSGWNVDEARATLEEDMEHVAELLRKEETRKMVAVIE
ncbi:hypothetical protein JCM3774_006356, partial [Rhodotorula dairenensis]